MFFLFCISITLIRWACIEYRTNPVTGKEEFWNQPQGLPGVCDRCKPLNECLGLINLEEQEWESVENLITQTTNLLEIKGQLKVKELKPCGAA